MLSLEVDHSSHEFKMRCLSKPADFHGAVFLAREGRSIKVIDLNSLKKGKKDMNCLHFPLLPFLQPLLHLFSSDGMGKGVVRRRGQRGMIYPGSRAIATTKEKQNTCNVQVVPG